MEQETFFFLMVVFGVFVLLAFFFIVVTLLEIHESIKEVKTVLEKPEKDKQEIEKAKKLLFKGKQ